MFAVQVPVRRALIITDRRGAQYRAIEDLSPSTGSLLASAWSRCLAPSGWF